MTASAVIFMIIIALILFGGLAWALSIAMKNQ